MQSLHKQRRGLGFVLILYRFAALSAFFNGCCFVRDSNCSSGVRNTIRLRIAGRKCQ